MGREKFAYDEKGASFFYFLLSFLAVTVVTATYYFWSFATGTNEQQVEKKTFCRCSGCTTKRQYLINNYNSYLNRRRIIRFVLLVGWVAFFATAYKCANIKNDFVAWDPFEILGIAPDASPVDIKKAYRRLSLIYHPDKENGDPTRFLKISKAYAALTDDTARKNWEMYGNPDGPGATSFGIALPAWIVEPGNSVFVLGAYALLFMIILPVTVGMWWYKSMQYGCDKVLLITSKLYYSFIDHTPHMSLKRVLMILAASLEFCKIYNPEIVERPQDNQEVPQLMRELDFLAEKNREEPLCYSYSIKARALIYAHLGRMKLPPQTLDLDRSYIVKKCPYLLQEFVNCAAHMTTFALSGRISRKPDIITFENAMKLCPMIVQALWEFKSPLLQLPHVTDDHIKYISSRKRNLKSIEDLARLSCSDRRSLFRNITDQQYEDILNVMSHMPCLQIATKFEVLDDEDPLIITAGSIVTVTVTMKRVTISVIFNSTSEESNNSVTQAGDEQNSNLLENKKISKIDNAGKRVWQKDRNKKKNSRGVKIKNKSKKNQGQALLENRHALNNSNNIGNIDDNNNSDDEADDSDQNTKLCKTSKSEEKDNVDNIEDEDDEEWEKCQKKLMKKQKMFESKPKKSHSVHCPYFMDDKQEFWWVYLVDRKHHCLITAPLLVTSLVDTEEVELKFTAPGKPGVYSYNLIVRSDSYVDCIFQKMATVDIKPPKVYNCLQQWDFPEDDQEEIYEEDSAVEDSDLISSDSEHSEN